MKAPINTAQEAEENPLQALSEAMVFGGSGAIERQEATGQASLVESDTLPSEGLAGLLMVPGMQLLGEVPDDPIFRYVKLPDGWKKARTDHSMWSDLLDEKGRLRAQIFYKAAFYDRRAFIRASCRFNAELDYDREKAKGESVYNVMDSDTGCAVYTTAAHKIDPVKSWEAPEAAREEAKAWLAERYPNHEDPAAYWDAAE